MYNVLYYMYIYMYLYIVALNFGSSKRLIDNKESKL